MVIEYCKSQSFASADSAVTTLSSPTNTRHGVATDADPPIATGWPSATAAFSASPSAFSINPVVNPHDRFSQRTVLRSRPLYEYDSDPPRCGSFALNDP